MKDVKIPTHRSYDEYFISALKNSDRAAGYIEAILEPEEPDSELLRSGIKDVIEAREQMNSLSDEAKQKWEKFDQMLSKDGGAEIYSLVELLDALGFRIAIAPKETNL